MKDSKREYILLYVTIEDLTPTDPALANVSLNDIHILPYRESFIGNNPYTSKSIMGSKAVVSNGSVAGTTFYDIWSFARGTLGNINNTGWVYAYPMSAHYTDGAIDYLYYNTSATNKARLNVYVDEGQYGGFHAWETGYGIKCIYGSFVSKVERYTTRWADYGNVIQWFRPVNPMGYSAPYLTTNAESFVGTPINNVIPRGSNYINYEVVEPYDCVSDLSAKVVIVGSDGNAYTEDYTNEGVSTNAIRSPASTRAGGFGCRAWGLYDGLHLIDVKNATNRDYIVFALCGIRTNFYPFKEDKDFLYGYNQNYCNTALAYLLDSIKDESSLFPYGNIDPIPPKEESEETDDSEEDSKGTRDDSSDEYDFDDLPTSTIGGGLKLLNGNITTITQQVWSTDFITWVVQHATGMKPLDYIIAYKQYPANIEPQAETPIEYIDMSGVFEVEAGGVNDVPIRYTTFDCGELKVDEYFASWLDYDNTTVSIYVPFCNYQALNIDEVMNATLSLKYKVDLLTGECLAQLKATRDQDGTKISNVIGEYRGNVSSELPVTSDAYANLVGQALSLTVGAIPTSGKDKTASALASAMSGSVSGLIGGSKGVEKVGNIAGNIGVLAQRTPFLIIERPIVKLPANYPTTHGYTVLNGGEVGKYTGFNVFESVRLEGINCTEEERTQIADYLRNGVII